MTATTPAPAAPPKPSKPHKLFDLSGKIALVTGASRGIGAATAQLLAEHGAHVIVSSRRIDGCQAVVDEIVAKGGSASALPCHIGEMDAIVNTIATIRETHGRLDILVNNAAANPYYGHVLDTDLVSFQKTVDVNIRGYFFMSVEAGKLMRDGGGSGGDNGGGSGGTIINTASIAALQPPHFQAVYAMSKASIVAMTKAFAKECGPLGIRCNAILPGLTKTKFAGALFEDDKTYQGFVQAVPLGRHAEPQEMAGTMLYLASDASSYTTGECIVVDGGLTI